MIPLLEMDWMKRFKLTIERIHLVDNNQSEKGERNNKRYRYQYTIEAGTLSDEAKGQTNSATPTR